MFFQESRLSGQMVDPEKQGLKINLICRAICRNKRELVTEDYMQWDNCSILWVLHPAPQGPQSFIHLHPIAQTTVGLCCRDVTPEELLAVL